ncbi:MAG: type II secretion system GspH family protein [Phycisphaerae bacterium]|nr:type II secretion system GspH family protein [Phycisphaerae bacterium]
MKNQNRQKGFTLIELLVVISIIAFLVATLMSAPNSARQKATGAVCLAQQKALFMAWDMYADDNGDYIVGGNTYLMADALKVAWVKPPTYEYGGYEVSNPYSMTYDMKVRGIMNGLLWKYIETIEIYHCPGNKREFKNGIGAYRSYSIPWQMNGHYGKTYWNGEPDDWHIGEIVKKRGSIKSSAEKFVFVEDSDDRGYNMGSWVLDGNPNNWSWVDAMTMWHNDSSTLGFADGHAEMHKWNKESIEYFMDPFDGGWDKANQPGNPDLTYAKRGVLPTGKI